VLVVKRVAGDNDNQTEVASGFRSNKMNSHSSGTLLQAEARLCKYERTRWTSNENTGDAFGRKTTQTSAAKRRPTAEVP